VLPRCWLSEWRVRFGAGLLVAQGDAAGCRDQHTTHHSNRSRHPAAAPAGQQASWPARQLQKSAAAGLCKIHYKFLFLDVFWGAGKLETDRYAVPQYPGESETFEEHEERVWDLWYGLGWTKINCTLQHQFASQLTYLDPHGNLCES
jgi:hypothetical protein